MDPATALGLVASVLQILQAVPQVKRYLNDVLTAPRQAERLQTHYRSIEALSGIVDDILSGQPDLQRYVNEFQAALRVLDPLIAPDKARGFARLTWGTRSAARTEISNAIQRDTVNLTIALQANTAYSTRIEFFELTIGAS